MIVFESEILEIKLFVPELDYENCNLLNYDKEIKYRPIEIFETRNKRNISIISEFKLDVINIEIYLLKVDEQYAVVKFDKTILFKLDDYNLKLKKGLNNKTFICDMDDVRWFGPNFYSNAAEHFSNLISYNKHINKDKLLQNETREVLINMFNKKFDKVGPFDVEYYNNEITLFYRTVHLLTANIDENCECEYTWHENGKWCNDLKPAFYETLSEYTGSINLSKDEILNGYY